MVEFAHSPPVPSMHCSDLDNQQVTKVMSPTMAVVSSILTPVDKWRRGLNLMTCQMGGERSTHVAVQFAFLTQFTS